MTVRRVVLTSDIWMRGAVLKLSCERSDFLASAILRARRLGRMRVVPPADHVPFFLPSICRTQMHKTKYSIMQSFHNAAHIYLY